MAESETYRRITRQDHGAVMAATKTSNGTREWSVHTKPSDMAEPSRWDDEIAEIITDTQQRGKYNAR
jgi:hypothetical protein